MISFSKKLYYAIEAVLYIAYNSGNGPISGRDISEKQGLPSRYLEQLMQKLVRGGLLRSVRGPHGGYVLARERRRITLGDICNVLRDDSEDNETEGYGGTPLGSHVVLPVWNVAHHHMMVHLKQVDLASLCEHAAQQNIKKTHQEKMDFTI